jgi:hypothetical protein
MKTPSNSDSSDNSKYNPKSNNPHFNDDDLKNPGSIMLQQQFKVQTIEDASIEVMGLLSNLG